MNIRRNLRIGALLSLLAAGLANAVPAAGTTNAVPAVKRTADEPWTFAATNARGRYAEIRWSRAKELRPGVKGTWLSIATPQLMKAYVLRCDLSRFDFAATRRSPDFGKAFGAGGKLHEGTRRETTQDFIARQREVVVAVNTSPWAGGVHCGKGILPADPSGLCISYGQVLSEHPSWTNVSFAVRRDGSCAILCTRPTDAERAKIVHSLSGFGVFLKDGVPLGARDALHPRTAFGLSRDRRWLYILAVDGRQPLWSHGASNRDLAMIMLAAGAHDGINMDGGGSTSLWVRDPRDGKPRQLNRHDAARKYQRPVAINLGLVERKRRR